jgi:hypothetical protein
MLSLPSWALDWSLEFKVSEQYEFARHVPRLSDYDASKQSKGAMEFFLQKHCAWKASTSTQ